MSDPILPFLIRGEKEEILRRPRDGSAEISTKTETTDMTAAFAGMARLPPDREKLLDHILGELRKSGASEEDINSATPGLADALFADGRASRWSSIFGYLSGIGIGWILIAVPIIIYLLIKLLGLSLVTDSGVSFFWIIEFLTALTVMIYFPFDRLVKPTMMGYLYRTGGPFRGIRYLISILAIGALITIWTIFVSIKVWKHNFSMLSWSIWDFIAIVLSFVWVITAFRILFNKAVSVRGFSTRLRLDQRPISRIPCST